MTEEHAAVFIQRAFHSSYIYRFPEDKNKCYHFRLQNLNKPTPSLICGGCKTIRQQRENKGLSCGGTIAYRSFDKHFLKEDPRLNHIDGCEPMLYSKVMQKRQLTEKNAETTERKSGFQLLHVQRYAYSVVYRLEEDETLCYRFNVLHKGFSELKLQCNSCLRLSNTFGHNYYCIPSGFRSDPSGGHLPNCQPLPYYDVMKENEIIGTEDVEKVIFRKKSADEPLRNTNADEHSDEFSEESTNCNVPNVHVIEVQQRISYIYRLLDDEEKCYRFILKKVRKNHISLNCSSCISIKNYSKGLKINPATTWETDGFTTKQDPTLNHYPECKPEPISDVLKMFRILEDEKPSPNKGGFRMIRIMKIGKRNLMYTLPADTTKCYHFQCAIATSEPFCATCNGIIRMNKVYIRPTKYKVTSTGFHDDPLVNHLPECKPKLTKALLNKYQITDRKSAIAIMAVHIIEKQTNQFSYIYRLKSDLDKCYRFFIRSGGHYSTMKCSSCMARQNKDVPAICRESDILSMKLDPSLDHRPHCHPHNYADVCKTHSKIQEDKDTLPRFEYILEKWKRRTKLCALYICTNDPTKCIRFEHAYSASGSIVVWICSSCKPLLTKGRRTASKSEEPKNSESLASYSSSVDGFIDDPRLNHVVGCEQLCYSDVMKDFQFVDESTASNLFKNGVNRCTENSILDGSPKINQKKSKSKISKQKTTKTKTTMPTMLGSGKKIIEIAVEKNSGSQDAKNEIVSSNIEIMPKFEAPNSTFDSTHSQGILGEDEIVVEQKRSSLILSSGYFKTRAKNAPVKLEDEYDIKPDMEDRKPQIFKYLFEIPFFSADELEVKFIERAIHVECLRKVSTCSVVGGRLSYAIVMPDSIDIPSIECF